MPINSFLYPGAKFIPAYEVANSCRFDASSSAYMHKTPSSTGVEEKFTFSFWIKYNHNHSSNQCVLFIEGDNGSDDYVEIAFKPQLDIQFNNGTYSRYETNRKFRDPSAWYHIVIAVDTTQSTASNRLKLYVNGTQETSWATETQIPQNDVLQSNTSGKKMWLNAHYNGPKNFIDGYLAEVVWIDGTQYAASDFGEFDEDSPTIWKPKDVSGLTFGTNGFYLDFEDSSNLGNDANGGTDLTEVNLAATDQATDTPTNNFCTLNPLFKPNTNATVAPTLSEGNLKTTRVADSSMSSTFGVAQGKWYFEVKYNSGQVDGYPQIGVTKTGSKSTGSQVGFHTPSGSDYRGKNGTSVVADAFDGTISSNDIMGFYVDLDNSTLIVHKNGSDFMGSGASSGIDFSSTSFDPDTGFFQIYYNTNANSTHNEEFNFGGCSVSAISSGNADANGYGNFEYSPTLSGTDYYALCTQNLAEFG